MTGSSTVTGPAKGRASKRTVDQAKGAAKSRRRRRRIIAIISVLLVILIAAGLTVWGIHQAQKKPKYQSPMHTSQLNDGIVAGGTGKIRVDMYVAFPCPKCKVLNAAAAPALAKLVASNTITLVYHPMSALDATTNSQYSTRAASSTACAADYGYFLPYTQQLLANQPAATKKPGPGLSDDQLVQLGGRAGMIDPHFAQCVRADKYRTWVAHVTSQARAKHVIAAPTVLVNGRSVAPAGGAPTLAELQSAVAAAS